MVEQRLKLSAKVILEDLPPPDVPEYDEFPGRVFVLMIILAEAKGIVTWRCC